MIERLLLPIFFITTLLSSSSCKLAEYWYSPQQVKARVMSVVEAQRANRDWMQRDNCPADTFVGPARKQSVGAEACAWDPSRCLSACNGGDPDSCNALAQLIQQNDVVSNDVADVLYRKSCSLGIVSGCTNAAANLFEQEDAAALTCAARTFEVACGQDDPWGCAMDGFASVEGIGRPKDVDKGKNSLEKACAVSVDKNGPACARANELKAVLTRREQSQR